MNGPGDINGDGHPDLLIGDPDYLNYDGVGRSYLVFGGSRVGSSGVITLAALNGINGFKLNGQSGDFSGYAVSGADINADGYSDFLIGTAGNSGPIRNYAVFGWTGSWS